MLDSFTGFTLSSADIYKLFSKNYFRNTIKMLGLNWIQIVLHSYGIPKDVGLELDPNCLTLLWHSEKCTQKVDFEKNQ